MSYHNIIDVVSKKLKLSSEIVDKTYKVYWLYIRQHIQSLPLKMDINKDEFNALKTNFNIPSLGKLFCTYDKFINMKRRLKILNNMKKNA